MLKAVEGVYKNGKIELSEPVDVREAKVIVTFLPIAHRVDLRERGIDAEQAADLRRRLSTFANDWDDPAMDAYDTYLICKPS
ncbi:MAG: hypothetical protein O3A46_02570 [Candidatus Poribacteria bacterium]|nr:hypothetical protein [Candidatus Poribacteria bacterium]